MFNMTKTITKIGNSKGLIFDAALLNLAKLKEGDQVNLEVHANGTITLTPLRQTITADQARETTRKILAANDELFKRLAQ